jgi:ketosteroid isomerase-like protein
MHAMTRESGGTSRLCLLAILILSTFAAACSSGGQRAWSTTEEDMVAVSRMLVTFDRLAAEADLAGFLDYILDDAVLMPPDGPAIVGKRLIASWYSDLYDQFVLDMTHEPLETDVFGDIIIHRGNARGTMTPKTGAEPIAFDNKYLFVLRKGSDGSLKIWRAMFNSNRLQSEG